MNQLITEANGRPGMEGSGGGGGCPPSGNKETGTFLVCLGEQRRGQQFLSGRREYLEFLSILPSPLSRPIPPHTPSNRNYSPLRRIGGGGLH